MESTISALVLKRWDTGETDRKISVLTRERGRMEVFAKGARKPGSRLASATEPLSFVKLQVAEGKRSAYITQAEPQQGFRRLRLDFLRLSSALCILEIVASLSHSELINEDLFEATLYILECLDTDAGCLPVTVWGLLKLLQIEGVQPLFDHCAVCDKAIKETPAWLSLAGGGYLCPDHAREFEDRIQFSAHALIALARTSELPEPPRKLKSCPECLDALHHLWRELAHSHLPAFKNLVQFMNSI